MSDHNPKIKILTDDELRFAIKSCEEKAMWPLVACLLELAQFRSARREEIRRMQEEMDDAFPAGSITVVDLKIQLEKDRKAKQE
jgi:hypothetical protein